MVLDLVQLGRLDLAVDVWGQQPLKPGVCSICKEADQRKFAFTVSDDIWRVKVPDVPLAGPAAGPWRD